MKFISKLKEKLKQGDMSPKNLLGAAKDKMKGIENKKVVAGVIGAWAMVLLGIVVVCRMNGTAKEASGSEQNIVIESDSTTVLETTTKKSTVKKTTAATTTEEITTTQEETTTEPQPETTEQVLAETSAPQPIVVEEIVERETIPIENIEVSNKVLVDDVKEPVKPIEIVIPIGSTVKPSTDDSITNFSNCIDISYHQGKIDWAAVKSSGIEYAFIRVGYRGYETGKLGKDIRFDENMQGAIDNGIKVGVYFFSQAMTEQEALEEASVTLSYIKGYDISLPVVIDWETSAGYRTYTGLSKDRLTSIISTFCDAVASNGYTPMVYMCKADYLNRVDYSNLAAKYKLWVAWYFERYYTDDYSSNKFTYGDELPALPFSYKAWQYTSKGRVAGINELVDMNVLINNDKKYDPELKITNTLFTTNIMSDVDIMEGVTAKDTNGAPAVKRINVKITNKAGVEVSKEDAIRNAGQYTIHYTFKAADDTVLNKEATLYVRDIPKMYFQGSVWADYDERTLAYEYDSSISVAENLAKIKELLYNNVSASYYNFVEGASSENIIRNGQFKGVENIVVNGDIVSGEYRVTYTVNDGKGLNNSRVIRVIVTRAYEETSTQKDTEADTESSVYVETESNQETTDSEPGTTS